MPRERTTTDTVYQFDELSDRAKETARDWFRQCIAEDFTSFSGDNVVEDASRIALLFGLDIRQRPVNLMNGKTRMEPDVYYSVGDRGAGASYSASYSYAKDGARKVAKEAPATWTNADGTLGESKQNAEVNRIAQALQDVQRRNFYKVQARVSHIRSSRDFGMDIDVERADDTPMSEADIDAVKEALNDFADWLHQQLELEWEYQNSDACIDENIGANEYEFTEDGNRA